MAYRASRNCNRWKRNRRTGQRAWQAAGTAVRAALAPASLGTLPVSGHALKARPVTTSPFAALAPCAAGPSPIDLPFSCIVTHCMTMHCISMHTDAIGFEAHSEAAGLRGAEAARHGSCRRKQL